MGMVPITVSACKKQQLIQNGSQWAKETLHLVSCLTGLSSSCLGSCVQALDRWEERLENIWEGKPYDILDAALADTVQKFPVHIQPFRDMIGGMRIDLVKSRYNSFDELYEYMYR